MAISVGTFVFLWLSKIILKSIWKNKDNTGQTFWKRCAHHRLDAIKDWKNCGGNWGSLAGTA